MALNGVRPGWWKQFVEKVPDGYFDLLGVEEDASRIAHFHPTFVPGLLQTQEYATAITPATTLKKMSNDELATLVEVRLHRQEAVLRCEHSKELLFLLDETVLRRPVGSPDTMRRQLLHLLDVMTMPSVSLVVLPYNAQPHPGLLGAFMLLQYGKGVEDVLCFEWQMGNTIVRGRPTLSAMYRSLVDGLAAGDPSGIKAKDAIHSALADMS